MVLITSRIDKAERERDLSCLWGNEITEQLPASSLTSSTFEYESEALKTKRNKHGEACTEDRQCHA